MAHFEAKTVFASALQLHYWQRKQVTKHLTNQDKQNLKRIKHFKLFRNYYRLHIGYFP